MSDFNVHDEMNKERFLKQGYLDAFGPGTKGYAALQHLMKHIWAYDLQIRTHDDALICVGLRSAAQIIWKYLELEPDELVRFSYRYYVQKQNGE